jgi:uncharacterized membrane protein/protein-disulfide isomerase
LLDDFEVEVYRWGMQQAIPRPLTAFCSEPWLSKTRRAILVAVSGTALLLASYLAYMRWSGQISHLRGCGGSDGCANLLGGRWGSWLLVPVSVWASLAYLALLGLSARGLNRWWSRTLALFGGLLLFAAALWFVGLQLFVAHQFCRYCSLLHACGVVIAILLWQNLWARDFAGRRTAIQSAVLLTVGSMLALIGGQLWGPQPATHEIRQLAADDLPDVADAPTVPASEPLPLASEADRATSEATQDNDTASPPASPSSSEPASAASSVPRIVTFMDGKLRYVVGELPLIGNPSAEHVIVKCFDYTCETCREMHQELTRVLQLYPEKIAVIVAPTPLNRSCNPHVASGVADHRYACQFARLGLAVWRAKPTVFSGFHDELFRRQQRITVAEARDEAIRLVGLNALEEAELDPWIPQVLRRNAEVYRGLSRAGPEMPKLLLGGNSLMNGIPRDTATLIQALRQHVALD